MSDEKDGVTRRPINNDDCFVSLRQRALDQAYGRGLRCAHVVSEGWSISNLRNDLSEWLEFELALLALLSEDCAGGLDERFDMLLRLEENAGRIDALSNRLSADLWLDWNGNFL